MRPTSVRGTVKLMLAAACAGALTVAPGLGSRTAHAATTTTVQALGDGGFESGAPQSVWTESRSSGAELIDTIYPHSGAWAADLCNIDNCSDGHGNAGDMLTQALLAPGQVVSAQLAFSYSIATSEPDLNASCRDWLTIGLGVGRSSDPTATKRYCSSTAAQYRSDSIDVTSYLRAQGGNSVNAQLGGFTDGLNPSEFFVDDLTLTITYLLTPSAPIVAPIGDCSVGQTTLTWAPSQFPPPSQLPVQSYTVTPYTVNGVAQPSTVVPGTQTSLGVSLGGGSICYFTVAATNLNGTGPAGSPSVPITSVTPPVASQTTGLTLNWALQPGSASASSYVVFIRDGTGPWLKWGGSTTTSSMVYGTPGHLYHYYVQALNAAGAGPLPSGDGEAGVTIPPSAISATGFKGIYGVDAYGVLHPAGSPPLAPPASWSWRIARGIAVRASGVGGYTLDGWGGIHPFGDAPQVAGGPYWSGWDIARGIALRPDGVSGYVVDGFGGVHAFGGAPTVSASAYWSGWDIARGLVLDPSGAGGYVLDGFGGVHPFGDARALAVTAYWGGWDIARGIVLRGDGGGGYVLDGYGGLHQFGAAPALRVSAYWSGWDIARGVTLLPSGVGGYIVDGYGGFHPFGGLGSGTGTPDYAGTDVVRGVGGA